MRAKTVLVAGLATAAVGTLLEYVTGVPGFPTVPPGPIILGVAAVVVAVVAWRWIAASDCSWRPSSRSARSPRGRPRGCSPPAGARPVRRRPGAGPRPRGGRRRWRGRARRGARPGATVTMPLGDPAATWREASTVERGCYVLAAVLTVSGVVHAAILLATGGSWDGPVVLPQARVVRGVVRADLATITWVLGLLPRRRARGILVPFAVACIDEVVVITVQAWRGLHLALRGDGPRRGPGRRARPRAERSSSCVTMTAATVLVRRPLPDVAPEHAPGAAGRVREPAGGARPRGVHARPRSGHLPGRPVGGGDGRAFAFSAGIKPGHAATMHGVLVLPVLAWLLAYGPAGTVPARRGAPGSRAGTDSSRGWSWWRSSSGSIRSPGPRSRARAARRPSGSSCWRWPSGPTVGVAVAPVTDRATAPEDEAARGRVAVELGDGARPQVAHVDPEALEGGHRCAVRVAQQGHEQVVRPDLPGAAPVGQPTGRAEDGGRRAGRSPLAIATADARRREQRPHVVRVDPGEDPAPGRPLLADEPEQQVLRAERRGRRGGRLVPGVGERAAAAVGPTRRQAHAGSVARPAPRHLGDDPRGSSGSPSPVRMTACTSYR